ncbi:methyltransferase domain-containing protein [Streptomyces sp. NPDC005438]|uniref:class I SAM-dependent methyltransferase n=1 Tax=Streptomyces sp. NPDC005438 TaxID=3156880 RepID=UPI0033B055EB
MTHPAPPETYRSVPSAPTAFDQGERHVWEDSAVAYADTFGRACAHPVPRLLDLAEVEAGTRLLDVGTGPGTVAVAARVRGARVQAVDAEPSMVRAARTALPEGAVHLAALPRLPFADGEFDAVVANFVLNHVGQPRIASRELRRVVRPGGRVAVTLWPHPGAPGQALLGRALRAGGAVRPDHLPPLDHRDDFRRDPAGLVGVLSWAGLRDIRCEVVRWEHRTTAEEWWRGPDSGVACLGRVVRAQPPARRDEIRRAFWELSGEFTAPDGALLLPHAALLAHGRR